MADVISKSQVWGVGQHLPACASSSSASSGSSVGLPNLTFCPPPPSSSSVAFESLRSSSTESGFHGRKMVGGDERGRPMMGGMQLQAVSSQRTLSIGKAMRWWEKGVQPNMREVESADDLVYSLLNTGNQLVVVDFFSPGCGGCRALHPKLCQFAEMNPEMMFLQVNYEDHKSMCYSLNVHVLPFFRFYRGSQGRLCSFSCTNATIKKFKDAMAKHNTERCSLGPAKGLEESELLALASNKDLNFKYTKNPKVGKQLVIPGSPQYPVPAMATEASEDKDLVTAWR